MLLVSVPATFIAGHNSILILRARVKLEAKTVSNEFVKLFRFLIGRCLVGDCPCFGIQISRLTIVGRAIWSETVTLKFRQVHSWFRHIFIQN